MKLRGHHLFCTTLFTGHGYSEAFTERMTALLSALNDGESAQLCVGADCLCEACPNREENGGCTLGTENAGKRDEAALFVLGCDAVQTIFWSDAHRKMLSLSEAQFQSVCGDCRWQKEGLCSLKLLQEQAQNYLI